MTELLYKELTFRIIGAIFEVHKSIGPGFVEKIYEHALAEELKLKKIPYEQQKKISVCYKNKIVGYHILDFVIDDKVVLELKSTPELLPVHDAQLISSLKAGKYRVGLLVNFAKKSVEHKRFVV
ncbi:MAG: GxxExxY protein [bacterium]